MMPFRYEQSPATVVFGVRSLAQVGDEVAGFGAERVMVIFGHSAALPGSTIEAQLGSRLALSWTEVAQHVPVTLADRARTAASECSIDMIVSVGGGSSTGLAKAIALTHRIPIVAVPTTYAGSEQTAIYGVTGGGHKQTGRDPVVLPRVVIYDPALTVGLPLRVTGPSAFNAMAHSVEALYATGCNPITSAIALEGVRAIAGSLPAVMRNSEDLDTRGALLVGAALSGMALGATSAGLHHKICHVLGGRFDLVHADAHSVILPHAVAFNGSVLPVEMAALAVALGAAGGDPASALWDLAVASRVPTRLADLRCPAGPLQRSELADVAEQVAGEITANPRKVTPAAVLGLLERAYDGIRPSIES